MSISGIIGIAVLVIAVVLMVTVNLDTTLALLIGALGAAEALRR